MTPPRIPLCDPSRAADTPGVREAMLSVLASGRYVQGDAVERFEKEFADYLEAAHCVGVGNGTDALEIALRAVGVGFGDRVVTVANAGFYASAAILAIGGLPVYVDIDPSTFLMSASAGQAVVSEASAVVLTHLYGDTSAGTAIAQLCQQAGTPLVMDCAQATGRGVVSGATVAAFSFYPTKNLAAVGDGGAVVSDDIDVAQRARQLSRYGWGERFHVERVGRNSRLDELQAAVLSVGLTDLDARNARRAWIRRTYAQALSGSAFHVVGSDAGHLAHLAVVTGPAIDTLRGHLEARGIATDVHYPIPDHLQPVNAGRRLPALPVTESVVGQIASIPCFPELTDHEVERVATALGEVARG